jgi:hypothetical protein
MNDKIRVAAEIGMLLVALAIIVTPVMAANMNLAGGPGARLSSWNTQSYKSFTPVIPVSTHVFSPPSYLYGKYANLNDFLSAGPVTVNQNAITIPSMAISNNDWNSMFGQTPAFMYSCGC